MINIVLWVFFSAVIISQFNYCSGDEVVPVSLEIIKSKINPNTSTIECRVTQDPIEISKGELIKLKVSSRLLIHFTLCLFDESDLETTIKQIPKVKTDKKDERHHYNFELYARKSGNWSCKFYTHRDTGVVKPTETIDNHVYTVATCFIEISINESMIPNVECMLVGVGIGLSWLIIPLVLGIVYCVKRRARPVHDLKSLSAMQRPKHDRARYSGAPLKKPLIMELTERESGIYEALETIQAKDKRTTLDRIKERPPLPLPIPPSQDSDDEYEAMAPNLPVKVPERSKNEFKATLKKQLPTPPTKLVEKPPKPIPTPPTQKKTLKSPLIGNPDTVNELQSVLKKKGIATQKPVPPSPAGKPPQATLPKASGPNLKPAPSITRKPLKPSPMDAPVPPPISTLPRPQTSVPVKVPEPEEDDCEWDGEDWTYEPLPTHNIYNI